MGTYRGVHYTNVDATDVKVGDRVVCFLADGVATVPVISIATRKVDLARYGLGVSYRLVFGYAYAPWWVDQSHMTFDRDQEVSIETSEEA